MAKVPLAMTYVGLLPALASIHLFYYDHRTPARFSSAIFLSSSMVEFGYHCNLRYSPGGGPDRGLFFTLTCMIIHSLFVILPWVKKLICCCERRRKGAQEKKMDDSDSSDLSFVDDEKANSKAWEKEKPEKMDKEDTGGGCCWSGESKSEDSWCC